MPKQKTKNPPKDHHDLHLDEPTPELTTKNFEEMFYNRQTQKSALDLLLTGKLQSKKSFKPSNRYVPPNTAMNLRSSDPTPPVEPIKTSPTPELSERHQNPEEVGVAMVNELLNRYETNKSKVLKEEMMKDQLDESEIDNTDLTWDDDFGTPTTGSDFFKYTIPQWEIKDKLCKMHYRAIESMTPTQVANVCKELIPELQKIMSGDIDCERHTKFRNSGLSKQQLREMTVAEPFTSTQDYHVMTMINDVMFSDRDPMEFNGELLHYVSSVLVPEALIRIYAKVNGIPNDLAEKELRYGAGYDGILSDDIIQTVRDEGTLFNKENII